MHELAGTDIELYTGMYQVGIITLVDGSHDCSVALFGYHNTHIYTALCRMAHGLQQGRWRRNIGTLEPDIALRMIQNPFIGGLQYGLGRSRVIRRNLGENPPLPLLGGVRSGVKTLREEVD